MNIKAKVTISRDSNGDICLHIVDDASRIEFVDFKMTPEHFAIAVTGGSYQPAHGEVRGLQYVCKTKVVEKRSKACPLKYSDRKTIQEWLLKNGQEDGWILDAYLGTQSSIGHDGTLNYSVYKYVEQP